MLSYAVQAISVTALHCTRVFVLQYMLVGGLKVEQPDHAARVARFALEVVEVAKTVPVCLGSE